MEIKGLDIRKELEEIKKYTHFDFSMIDSLILEESPIKGYSITQSNRQYEINYHKRNDLFAALAYIHSHEGHKDYAIKRQKSIQELGYMIDCARNAVPKIDTLKHQVIHLALSGYSYIGLYVEDVFEIKGEALFGYMRGRYSKEEIRELYHFADRFGIEVRPFIQTLAHLNGIFKHKEYHNVKDINDILLVGDTKTYDLIEKMIVTIKDTFQSEKINIGMDEAWMLGLGRYLQKNGFTDRMDIMINHLNTVMDICNKHAVKATMWADMFFHLKSGSYLSKEDTSFQDIESLIPNNLTLLYWDYYHTKQEDYDRKFKSLQTLSPNIAFAGAAWKWVGFAPFNEFSIKASKAAIASCLAYKIKHFLVTSWGDNGAEASLFSVLPSLIQIAEDIYDDQLGDVNRLLEDLTKYDLKRWMILDQLNQPYPSKEVKTVNPSKYLLYEDLLLGDTSITLSPLYSSHYKKLSEDLLPLSQKKSKYQYLFLSLHNLSSILELKASLSIDLYESYHQKNSDQLNDIVKTIIPEIQQRLQVFTKAFQRQWYQENKLQGFEVQSYRLGGLYARLSEIKEIILLYINGHIKRIDILEERILDLALESDPYCGCTYYNQFSKYISFGSL